MNTRYFPAAACGNSAAPASPAPVRIPRAARHQLWHLTSPLSLSRPALLPLAARASAPTWQTATSDNNCQPTSGTCDTRATAVDASGNVFVTNS